MSCSGQNGFGHLVLSMGGLCLPQTDTFRPFSSSLLYRINFMHMACSVCYSLHIPVIDFVSFVDLFFFPL